MKPLLYFLLLATLLSASCSLSESAAFDNTGKSGSITRFAVYKNYMYVLNLNEVQTYLLGGDGKPQLVHRLPTDYGLETIIVYDNTVYLGSSTALYILDIQNPAAPAVLSKTDRQIAFIGGCDPVVVKGNYAFSTVKIIENICGRVSAQSALLVYDVSIKTAPVQVGLYPLNLPNGLGYKDNYLFVCDEGADRLEVFDISNPLALKPTTYALPITDPYDLIVNGATLIVSTKTSFQFYDVSDIRDIRQKGSIAK